MPSFLRDCKRVRRPRPVPWAPGLLALAALASPVRAETLGELLAAVAANARFPAPARADLRVEREQDGATRTTTGLLLGRGRVLYLELGDGTRVLLRPGKAIAAEGRRLLRRPLAAPLDGTDFLLEDLLVFTADGLRLPQISDDGPAGVVVTGAPAGPSAYALLVYTIDREARTVLRTQYYRGSIGNLVKLRQDGGFTPLRGHPRPSHIAMEDLQQRSATRVTLDWHDAPDAPATRFVPAGLTDPPLLPGRQ